MVLPQIHLPTLAAENCQSLAWQSLEAVMMVVTAVQGSTGLLH